ncbi:MAG: hypothetical protein WB709_10405 [Solirubrobacteraceae bacterium]
MLLCTLFSVPSAMGAIGHQYVSQLTEVPLGTPASGQLSAPYAIAVDSSNNVWIADPGKGVVNEFDSSNNFLRQEGGEGHFSENGGRVGSIAVAPISNDLYVAEPAHGVIEIFSPAGTFLGELTGSETPHGSFQKNKGEGELSVAIDPSTGSIYVDSVFYHTIYKFGADGKFAHVEIPSSGGALFSMAAFGGDLFVVATGGGNSVVKYSSSGSVDTTFGDALPLPNGQLTGRETPVGLFRFEPTGEAEPGLGFQPTSGIAVDSTGALYIVDSIHKVVDEFDSSGKYLGQINGSETSAKHLVDPGGIGIGSTGNVYVSDFNPVRSSAKTGTGVVDRFGPEVKQNTLTTFVIGGAGVTLGDGNDSSVVSTPAGIEETQPCNNPVRAPFVGSCHEYSEYIAKILGCEGKCSAQYAPGTNVVLTETPVAGFKFEGWSGGGCSGKLQTCEVNLNTDTEVSATFGELARFPVSVVEDGSGQGEVTSEPVGIVCPLTCTHEFFENEKIRLTAKENSDSEFVKWTGCEVESGNQCEITIKEATEVKVEFNQIPQHTLKVVEAGSGKGKVISEPPGIECPSTCTHSFNNGEVVTLVAQPDDTSRVLGWKGCTEGPSKTECKITLNSDAQVEVEFEAIPQVGLTIVPSGPGAGLVTSTPVGIYCGAACSHEFNEGTIVKLSAAPVNVTSVFEGWSGGGCSGTGACEVTLAGESEVVATFAVVSSPTCPNARLRFEQPLGADLPDCRGYEMVSPSDKNDNDAVVPRFFVRSAVSGEAVTYESRGSFQSPKGAPFNSQYLSRRGSEGWATQNISPPTTPDFTTPIESQWMGMDFTPDLSKGLLINGDPPLSSGAPEGFESLYVSDITNGAYQFVAETQGKPFEFEGEGVRVGGSSTDLSHVVFEKQGNVFEWVDGVIIPVSNGSAHVGSGSPVAPSGPGLWHAVSSDGSKVFFTRRETGANNFEGQLFVWREGLTTVQVSASQRGTPDSGGVKPALFWDASADGSRVFFTSTSELTNDADTGPADNAANLYEYNVGSGTLTDLTVDGTDPDGASVVGVAGASEDGSYVYFVATGTLAGGAVAGQPNLYVRHEGTTSLIATLSSGDSSDWAEGPGENSVAVTPDGSRLAFLSSESLTGYDNAPAEPGECTGSCSEVFMFEASAGSLVCVSCNPSGARPKGSSDLYTKHHAGEGYLYLPRNFSDNGARLFFESIDGLVPHDSNGKRDVYEYEGGFVSLISDGAGSSASSLQDVSANGDDVFFATADQLLGQDRDNRVDLYDARINGGFPAAPDEPVPCVDGDTCHGPVSPAPGVYGAPSSSTFSGAGNLEPSPALAPVPVVKKVIVLSRAKKLSSALKVCKKKPKGKRRVACEVKARRRYGTVGKSGRAERAGVRARIKRGGVAKVNGVAAGSGGGSNA